MARFLQSGKFKGLFAVPRTTECATQSFTFIRKSPTQLIIDRVRRDQTSLMKRILLHDRSTLNFVPLSQESSHLGGHVIVSSHIFDFQRFVPMFSVKSYGVYTDDFLMFGMFKEKGAIKDQKTLLNITDENPELVNNRTTYSFDDNRLNYQYEDFDEPDLNIQQSELMEYIPETLKERLFYGLGNKYM